MRQAVDQFVEKTLAGSVSPFVARMPDQPMTAAPFSVAGGPGLSPCPRSPLSRTAR